MVAGKKNADVGRNEEEDGAASDPFLRTVGERFRAARAAAGMSQRDVAAVAGVSAAYIYLVEGGKQNVTLTVFRRLAKAVDVPMEDLLVGEAPIGKVSARTVEAVIRWIDTVTAVLEKWRGREKREMGARAEWFREIGTELDRLDEARRKLAEFLEKGEPIDVC